MTDEEVIAHPNYIALKRLLRTSNQSVEDLTVEVNALRRKNANLELKMEELVKSRMQALQIIQQTLNETNARNNEYLEENRILRKELWDLKHGD